MGQYWKPVNLDKKEYLHAHHMDGGLKLLEQAWSTGGVASALVLLLAPNPGAGGGDPRSGNPYRGRWAGDRIVFVGDYSKDSCCPTVPEFGSLYDALDDGYTNISAMCMKMLEENS